MQLESTLFGVCVIQIKPQLEKVLGLAEDALTKEIKLTQDLMELFIKYQIPADQLSFHGDESTVGDAKLVAVKEHVKAMQEMIKESMAQELEEAKMKAKFERAEEEQSWGGRGVSFGDDGGAGSWGEPQKECRSRGGGMRMMKSADMAFGCAMRSAPAPDRCAMRSAPAPDRCAMRSAPAPAPALASASAAAPAQAPQQAPANQPHGQQKPSPDETGPEDNGTDALIDFTKVPKEMDRRFEELDEDGSLRPTIITTGNVWTKKSQKALLGNPETSSLRAEEQRSEKQKAFDLLDALTRSGALPIDHASLHVVLAATHCFDKTILETVIQENVSPIEKVERSTLIMASTIHRMPPAALMQPTQLARVQGMSPMLFDASDVSN